MKKFFWKTVAIIISQNFLPIEVVLSALFLISGLILGIPLIFDIESNLYWSQISSNEQIYAYSALAIFFGFVGLYASIREGATAIYLRQKVAFMQFVMLFSFATVNLMTFGFFSFRWVTLITLACIAGIVRLQLIEA